MDGDPVSPLTRIRKGAPRPNRRSTINNVLDQLEDLHTVTFLEDADIPHPDATVRFPEHDWNKTHIDALSLTELLSEPLGRFYLNETLRIHRTEHFHMKSRQKKATPRGFFAGYTYQEDDERILEEEIAYAGIILDFLAAMFEFLRSKPSGRISKDEVLELSARYGVKIDFSDDKLLERELSKEDPITRGGLVEQQITDDVRNSRTLAKVNLASHLLVRPPKRSSDLGAPSASTAKPIGRKSNLGQTGEGISNTTSKPGKSEDEIGGLARQSSVKQPRRSILGLRGDEVDGINDGSFETADGQPFAQQATRRTSKMGAQLDSMKSFKIPKLGLIDEQASSSSKMLVQMDLQKSLADSFLSSDKTSSIDHSASLASFTTKLNADGSVALVADSSFDRAGRPLAEIVVETIAEGLKVVFQLFKENVVLVNKYLDLRAYSMRTFGDEDLQRVRVLGHGSWGEVHAVSIRTIGFLLAQKNFAKSMMTRNSKAVFMAELTCLRTLTLKPSPFCLRLIAAYETPTMYHIVLPCGNGGDLRFLLTEKKKLDLDHTRFYACEIALAIHHLHSLGFLYRDLKPANILLDGRGHCLLVDFGFAIYVGKGDGKTTGKFGTAGYIPLEVLENKPYSVDTDWWAYGCVLFEMLHGVMPFDISLTGLSHRDEGVRKFRQLTFPPGFPEEAKALIAGLLNKNVTERTGCNGLGVKEIFSNSSFWKHWHLDVSQFRGRADELPEPPYVPNKKEVHAKDQVAAGMHLDKLAVTAVETPSMSEFKFQPYTNKQEIQRDIVRLIEYDTAHGGALRVTSSFVSVGANSMISEENSESIQGNGISPRSTITSVTTNGWRQKRSTPGNLSTYVEKEKKKGCVLM